MKKFSNYQETKVNDFSGYEKIKLGGHYCKILEVKLETIQGKTGPFEQLNLKIDITDPDEQANFYANKFKADADANALDAKWKGYYKVNVPKDDGSEMDEKTKVSFKTFITCIEKSNQGYDWEKADWDEKTLVGKKFLGVFGIEEFVNLQGTTVYTTKCRFARSTETPLEDIKIPKVRCADNTYVDYEEWLNNRKNNDGLANENVNSSNDDVSDDLPF